MKKWMWNGWVRLVLRLIIGGIFVYAGWAKIQAPQAFADSIATFQVVPLPLINLIALGLPFFEILLGLCLLTGCQKEAAIFSVIILSTVFALALIQALIRGLEVDCGCFGSGPPSIGKTWASLGRDLLMFVISMILYCKHIFDKELLR